MTEHAGESPRWVGSEKNQWAGSEKNRFYIWWLYSHWHSSHSLLVLENLNAHVRFKVHACASWAIMIFTTEEWFGLYKLTTYQLVNALTSFGPTQCGPLYYLHVVHKLCSSLVRVLDISDGLLSLVAVSFSLKNTVMVHVYASENIHVFFYQLVFLHPWVPHIFIVHITTRTFLLDHVKINKVTCVISILAKFVWSPIGTSQSRL